MKPTGIPFESPDHVRRDDWPPARIQDIRGEVLEARAGVSALHAARDGASGLRRGAPSLHDASQLLDPVVELVVADRAHLEAHLAQDLHRGLVAEEHRGERRRADEIAARDHDAVAGAGSQALHDARERRRATDGNPHGSGGRSRGIRERQEEVA
jgi:hypothetical protein